MDFHVVFINKYLRIMFTQTLEKIKTGSEKQINENVIHLRCNKTMHGGISLF